MMERIAVLGVGAIGSMVGGRLALGGADVTLICTSWRENAEHMKEHGLTVAAPDGGEDWTPVRALFIDELAQLPAPVDLLLIATKSNDTERCLASVAPYLAADALVVSLQNGFNEEVIIPLVGRERGAACVSYTGGLLVRPGYVRSHGGRLVVGELDGRVTPRIEELARILRLVTETEISGNVLLQRWDKLAQVTMTIPVGTITGVGFPAILQVEEAHPLLARLMCETLAVADAAGYHLEEVAGLTRAEWQRLAGGPVPELSDRVVGPFRPRPGAPAFNPDEAPLLKDLKLGLPLEIDFTNGYVIKKGRELGVPTPAHDLAMQTVAAIARGDLQPGLEQLAGLLSATAPGK